MRAEQLDTGEGRQVAATQMEPKLSVAERLDSRTEPRLSAPGTFRDRPHTAALKRKQVEDEISLAIA